MSNSVRFPLDNQATSNGKPHRNGRARKPRPQKDERETFREFLGKLKRKQKPHSCDGLLEEYAGKFTSDETMELAREECEAMKAQLQGVQKQEAQGVLHPTHNRSVAFWTNSYVFIALGLSAYLNGFANAVAVENKVAGWTMGCMIPLLVFLLFKASGWMLKQGNHLLGPAAAVVGTGLLLLSVVDCQAALSMLTHSPFPWLSWAFALGIDAGFVVCELGAMGIGAPKERR